MSSKTISLREEAYERLRAARRYPGESFSAVVLRASWPETTTTGKAFLDICRERGAVFEAAELDRVEALKRADRQMERTVIDIYLPTEPRRSPFSAASRAWHVAR